MELLRPRRPRTAGVAAVLRDSVLGAVGVPVVVLEAQAVGCSGEDPGA